MCADENSLSQKHKNKKSQLGHAAGGVDSEGTRQSTEVLCASLASSTKWGYYPCGYVDSPSGQDGPMFGVTRGLRPGRQGHHTF